MDPVCHCLRRTKLRDVDATFTTPANAVSTQAASSAVCTATVTRTSRDPNGSLEQRHERNPAIRPRQPWCPGRGYWSAALIAALLATGCDHSDTRRTITIWHQARPAERELLQNEIERFEAANPTVRVRALYKETEELRSGFQAAALAGGGPGLVYGPSDVLDTFQTMGILQDMSPWFPKELHADFVEGALTFLPGHSDPSRNELVQIGDRFGNHLALVYNRRFVADPPKTTDELVELAVKNTLDENGDGRKERYGLVWNFTEPFFSIPFVTGYGAWVFAEPASLNGPKGEKARPVPALDSTQAADAYRFIKALRDEHGVVPANCDYELADALFKTGRAAMIINGDWSWADYLNNREIDAAVAVLPVVSETGLPMKPMIAPKGYSLNANTPPELAEQAMAFVRHMTSSDVQHKIVERLRMLPASRSALENPLFKTDPTLQASLAQLENGRLMPVETELRAVWDAMRPPYQALLGGAMTADAAAAAMQQGALEKIRQIRHTSEPTASVAVIQWLGTILIIALIIWQRNSFIQLLRDWRRNRLAYLFVLPSIIAIFAVIVFPFFYNIVLSLSNMSLGNFRDWQVVGGQNYVDVVTDPKIWPIFGKTIIWTVVNVAFHAGLGLMLAVALNGPIRGKALYRILLIIPWAVPAYITALTWRGMFDYEYGAVNLLLEQAARFPPIRWVLGWIGLTPPVNWLGDVWHAFEACIVANVWLGFPFMMVIALGGMQGIPQELYEAARIDRASRWQQFWHITLPMLKPVLLPAITLGTIWTFNNLNIVWLVSNTGEPQDKTHILVSYVYKAVFNSYQYGYGAALSMLIFCLLLAFSMLFLSRTRATESVYG
ncbi:MAG: extracellular solute-binding protein [Planctomycetes bacterium]|nr:extracellular solute-binding protein [Planctomycetota bacterium]